MKTAIEGFGINIYKADGAVWKVDFNTYIMQHEETVKAYIPNGRWYDWYKGNVVEGEGTYVMLDAPLDKIPLLVRGGYILPIQMPANTTTERSVILLFNSSFQQLTEEQHFVYINFVCLVMLCMSVYMYVCVCGGVGAVSKNANFELSLPLNWKCLFLYGL